MPSRIELTIIPPSAIANLFLLLPSFEYRLQMTPQHTIQNTNKVPMDTNEERTEISKNNAGIDENRKVTIVALIGVFVVLFTIPCKN